MRGFACAARTPATHRIERTGAIMLLMSRRIQSSAMRRTVLVLSCLLAVPSSALATWSVVAVDRATGRVVIASATCVNGDDDFLKNVQAVVVPGKGVAACQAAVDNTHQNQMLVFRELQKGTDPAHIVEMLAARSEERRVGKRCRSRGS